MRLEKKVALITGSGSNIGRSMARIFAREGARVVVNDINDEGGAETVGLIEKAGGQARFVHADISTSEGVRHAVAFAAETYGKVDIYLSNANSGNGGTIQEFDRAGTEHILAVNLLALLEGAHHCLPEMEKAGEGSIVCTSSVQALIGVQSPAYSAAKAALLGAVRTMAVELWPHKIRVNAICPGGVGGSMWEVVDRLGEECLPEFEERFGRELRHLPMPVSVDPTAIAYAALYLASEEARFVTGQHLTVDAGLSMIHYGLHSGPPPLDTPAATRSYQERLQQEFRAWLEEKEKDQQG